MFETILNSLTEPVHAHAGEAFLLHQSLATCYYTLLKCTLYAGHSAHPDLKEWWSTGRGVIEKQIEEHIRIMKRTGIPLPPSIPMTKDLSDQFIAWEAAAMVKGMINVCTLGLQSTNRTDVGLLYRGLLDDALRYGAKLQPLLKNEGWMPAPPTFQGEPQP